MVVKASYADAKILDALEGTIPGTKIIPVDMGGPPEVYITEDDEKPFGTGMDLAKRMMIHGFNRITKKCPFRRHKPCIGEECALYFQNNYTGDCVLIWQMFK